ncbi:MAG: helix-turn-helix domain-containing protein [Treponema sp.]|nr:helix-turn-helix domain-containing protein [Treponema sp.]
MREKLTPCEQKILELLLKGSSVKDVSYAMNIHCQTVYFHRKNIFDKLGVNSSNELLIKCMQGKDSNNQPLVKSTQKKESQRLAAGEGFPPYFKYWMTFSDKLGTSINLSAKKEKINGKLQLCHTIWGKMFADNAAFAGFVCPTDYSSFKIIKESSSFSFNVLGDGNYYEVMLTTSDSRTKGEQNHHRFIFPTIKGKVSTVHVKMSDLEQAKISDKLRFGRPVKFIKKNIELFQFQIHTLGDFKFKIWNIRFYK